jgi:hypothetical protein
VTQDGGKPGVLQHFVGPQCSGDGWVLFRQDAPTGNWTEMVARLSNTNDGSCPASLGRAYTRWRLEDIALDAIFRPTARAGHIADNRIGALQPRHDCGRDRARALLLCKGGREDPLERLEQERPPCGPDQMPGGFI